MAGRILLYFSDCFKYSWMSSTVTMAWTLMPNSSLTYMMAVLPGTLPTSQRLTEMNISLTFTLPQP